MINIRFQYISIFLLPFLKYFLQKTHKVKIFCNIKIEEKKDKYWEKIWERSIPFINQLSMNTSKCDALNCKVTQRRIYFSIINISVGKQMTSTSSKRSISAVEIFIFFSFFIFLFFHCVVDDYFCFRYLLIISVITHRIKCMYVLELEQPGKKTRWNDDDEKEKMWWGIYGIKFLSNTINRARIWAWERVCAKKWCHYYKPLVLQNFVWNFIS